MIAFIWPTICPQFRDLIPCPVLSVTLHSHFPWPIAQTVKNLPGMRKTCVRSLGWEDALEEGMAIHSGILAWRLPMDRGAWQASVYGVSKSGHVWSTKHSTTLIIAPMDPDTHSNHGLQPCSTDPFSWALGLPHAHCPLQGSHVLYPLSPPGSTPSLHTISLGLLTLPGPAYSMCSHLFPTPCFVNPPTTALYSLLPMGFSTHWNFGSHDSLHPPYQPRSPSPLCSVSLAHFSHLHFDLWHYVLVLDQH